MGIVHRDIKPQNMLLSAHINDPNAIVKIADFGAAAFTCGFGDNKVAYGGTPAFQV
jgi:serine/threonine protein kinase